MLGMVVARANLLALHLRRRHVENGRLVAPRLERSQIRLAAADAVEPLDWPWRSRKASTLRLTHARGAVHHQEPLR